MEEWFVVKLISKISLIHLIMSLIIILTDFGNADGYVGVMKGVCLKKCPNVQFVDLSNQIPSQSVEDAAFVLYNSYKSFPKNSVFLCVVDPGVGTKRKIISAKIPSGQLFVAPDNGLLKYVLGDESLAEIFEINYKKNDFSNTFHGRDVMAPVAAELASGKDIKNFGKILKTTESLAEKIDNPPIRILHIDKFGNLITNILVSEKYPQFEINGFVINKQVENYEEAANDELLFIPGSSGFWEIAVKNGSAQKILFAKNKKIYRKNAAAVLVNNDGKVLVGWKHDTWQLPQGGVKKKESFKNALKRELCEEIGTDKFSIIKKSEKIHKYIWPENVRVKKKKKKYAGQRQKYFLVKFDGEEKDLDPDKHGEFSKLKWFTPSEAIQNSWEIKRPIYEKVFDEFGLIIN